LVGLAELLNVTGISFVNYIIKSLQEHARPVLNNVLYNGQAVAHTVSLLSVYKDRHKKHIKSTTQFTALQHLFNDATSVQGHPRFGGFV
jgi:hypothetical protein